MTTGIKDGDLYSFANVYLEGYGFLIRTNEGFCYRAEVTPGLAPLHPSVELHVGGIDSRGYSLNVRLHPDSVGKLERDRRSASDGSFLMVYRSGRSAEEVLEMIRPQLRDLLGRRREALEELVANVDEMIAATGSPGIPSDFLCSTAPVHTCA